MATPIHSRGSRQPGRWPRSAGGTSRPRRRSTGGAAAVASPRLRPRAHHAQRPRRCHRSPQVVIRGARGPPEVPRWAHGRPPRFLTLADVAEVLNTSSAQVYALVRRGDLPAIKIGGRGQWRVERAALEDYIERQ